jgi:ATP-dependent DNA helicase PIF1
MLGINIPDEDLANGSRGIIIDFTRNTEIPYPIVQFLNGKKMIVKPNDYILEEGKNIVIKRQIPLILSWAITIHKAQGMTLDFVKTDIGNSIFEYGQAYVVLSRIKNLEGLSLINIDYSKIRAHPKVLEYYNNLLIN